MSKKSTRTQKIFDFSKQLKFDLKELKRELNFNFFYPSFSIINVSINHGTLLSIGRHLPKMLHNTSRPT